MKTPLRRAAAGAVSAALLVVTAGCTADQPAAKPSPSESTGSTATLSARPVPFKVRVTRVAGRLGPKASHDLQARVGKVLRQYVDAAYLGGSYPRRSFAQAYAGFSPGVRGQARHDGGLLTNKTLGPTTQRVTPKETSAYLSVLAPHRVAAGVTARVTVRFVADRGDRPAQQVTVKGRLMLTRKRSGGWMIFGYDLSRSVRTVGRGA